MGITELKEKYSERLVSIVVTEIVVGGMARIREKDPAVEGSPLGVEVRKCFDDIDNSKWDDIRAIIKRSL